MTAIASTEHGLSRGAVAKKLECDKAGIKFIHGVEIYLTRSIEEKIKDNYHTILLAKNEDGRKELNRLMKLSSDTEHFYYTNRITFDEFVNLSDNIIKTSACLASPLNKLDENDEWFERLLMAYDFLEIQPHKDEEQIAFNKKLWELSKSFDIPLIIGTDTHSSTPYKAECRDIMLKQKGQSYGNEDHFDLSFKTYDELCEMMRVQDSLPGFVWEEAIDNTNVVARWCNSYELDTSIKYPILYGSPEEDERVFTERVWESLDDKVNSGIIPKKQEEAFRTAAQEELDVFHKIGMNGFMLSMSELIRWCKAQGMAIGTARGSVGGSRCAYLTDIIDLNPEQWHTVFSRFANEDRREIGDIDIDMIDEDRPKVFEYITNRFGDRKTARVAAYGTFQELNTIEAIVRGLGKDDDHQYYNLQLSDKIKKEFKIDPEATREKYKDVFYYFDGIVGVLSSQSVHPAGIVISPINLDEEYGTFEKDGEQCLLLDMEDAHEVGLAKYDFLILRNVQIIRDACRYAGIDYPQTYQIDFDDKDVWNDMLTSPYGIFQMEGEYAFQSLKRFKTQSIFDMSLVTACIRPSGASYREELLSHKPHHNPSPIIDDLLKDNEGYLIYQEDTIKFLQQICGLSGSEADNIRRAIGRKQRDRLEAALPQILDGYCSKSPQPREVAEVEAKEFLQILEDSASYQFG